MSNNYAVLKIREALSLSQGNEAKARQLIMEWAQEDMRLLTLLVRPHLTGITAHAVRRVLSGAAAPEPVPAREGERRSPPVQKAGKNSSFGMDILRTIAGGDTAQFGQENFGRPVQRKTASQQHIDAIYQIARQTIPKK